ncbi:NAD(P)-binding protein [Cadophora sp. DSE1049]|nr:NAD(P)-binding protein [Cadophora sp. DSE1049]
MSSIKNVVLAGASGNLGPAILHALLDCGKFNVTVLTRKESKATFPSAAKVVKVDYSSLESLTSAFQGQDAVISTLSALVLSDQTRMIDAAIATGVQRFLPSEFGSDLENPKARALPVYAGKVEIQNYLVEKAKSNPQFSYTIVRNGFLLDWGLQVGFIINTKDFKPTIYGSGDQEFSSTSLAAVGQAVVGVLSNTAETANRVVYVEEIALTQNKLLAMAKKLTPGKTWEPVRGDLDAMKAASDERLKQGLFDDETFFPYIFIAGFGEGYGGKLQKVDNELLGVKRLSEEDVEGILKTVIRG